MKEKHLMNYYKLYHIMNVMKIYQKLKNLN